MSPVDALAVGRRAGRKVCPTGPWVDDVAQAATIAAWQARPGCEAVAARCAAIDELRRLSGHGRRGGRTVVQVPDLDGVTVDSYPSDSALTLLRGRDRLIGALIAGGWSGASIAAALGVSPARVSQIVARIRRTVIDAA